MSTSRRARLLAVLASDSRTPSGTESLCRMAATATQVNGAGIMLITKAGPRGSLCTTDAISSLIEELQFSLGEGPCIDAHREGRAVTEPNLASPEALRWPVFTGPAVAAGVQAVFGIPIRIGAVRLGALSLYRDRPGSLTTDQYADSLAVAGLLAEAILALQADAEVGQIAEMLETDGEFHYVVHQASGMVAVQLGIGVEDAATRLRAYAFGSGRSIADVAHAVVEHHLRFDPHDDTDGSS